MQDLASNEEATDENSSKEEISGLETEQVQDDSRRESPPKRCKTLPVMKKLMKEDEMIQRLKELKIN